MFNFKFFYYNFLFFLCIISLVSCSTAQKPTRGIPINEPQRLKILGSNVYVLAIGVKGKNLIYPEDDAMNFVKVIKKIFRDIPDNNIKLMTNGEPTLTRVRREMYKLRRVTSDSIVFIYFSGHGTRIKDNNGDETDEYDEAFVLTNSIEDKPETLYIDDDFKEDLYNIPAKKKVIVVDACHSGTMTRTPDLRIKYWSPSANIITRKIDSISGDAIDMNIISTQHNKFSGAQNNIALLSACADSQSAQESEVGGIFTYHLLKIMEETTHSEQEISLENIFERTRIRVREATKNKNEQNPQKIDPNGIAKTIYFSRTPKIKQFDDISIKPKIYVWANQKEFYIEDIVSIYIKSEVGGYFYLLDLDSEQNINVLFPKQRGPEQYIPAGEIRSVRVRIIPPIGKDQIIAVISNYPLNLSTLKYGSLNDFFTELKEKGASGLVEEIQAKIKTKTYSAVTSSLWGVQKLTLFVKK